MSELIHYSLLTIDFFPVLFGFFLQPFPLHPVRQGPYPQGVHVQAGDHFEMAAACMQKDFLSFHCYFFQGFQAVADEGRANHRQFFYTLFG